MGDVVNFVEERTRRSISTAIDYVEEQNEDTNVKGFAFAVFGRDGQNMCGSFLEDKSKDAKLEMIALLELMKQSIIADIE